jgi:hypothetical protein
MVKEREYSNTHQGVRISLTKSSGIMPEKLGCFHTFSECAGRIEWAASQIAIEQGTADASPFFSTYLPREKGLVIQHKGFAAKAS